MTTRESWQRALYEISLSLRPAETLAQTARQALFGYVEHLPCAAGVVFEKRGDEYSVLTAYSEDERLPVGKLRESALETLATSSQQFPSAQSTEAGFRYYLLSLPEFGVLVLGTTDRLDEELLASLTRINERFAAMCRDKRVRTREQTLDRLYEEIETIFAAETRDEICKQAVTVAANISEAPAACIHLYNRSTESLKPAATTGTGVFDEQRDSYTDRETVLWEVYRQNEPLVIDEASAFDRRLPGDDIALNSAIVLPLGDHGVFVVSAFETNVFDSTDVSLFQLFTRLLEVALDRCKRIQGLEGIQEITRAIVAKESHEQIAQETLDRLPDVLDFPLATIWKHDVTTGTLRPVASTIKSHHLLDDVPTFSRGESLAWQAFENGETYTFANLDRQEHVYNEKSPISSEIIVPIGDFGVLITGSTHKESFSQSDQRLVETLTANIETAMRLADRRQELELLDQVLARILRHNIRTELNLIQGYASQILDISEGTNAELAGSVIDHCDDLAATAEHAREMQDIVRTRDDRTTVDLREEIEEAVSMAQRKFPRADITTRFDVEPTIVAHPNMMTAIRHLVENSIEHHDEGQDVAVTQVVMTTGENGEPVIRVSDNGPGIPESESDVLDRHGESALEHGSGAGLWLIDRVVEYSGGSVEFEPTADGTIVTICFET